MNDKIKYSPENIASALNDMYDLAGLAPASRQKHAQINGAYMFLAGYLKKAEKYIEEINEEKNDDPVYDGRKN